MEHIYYINIYIMSFFPLLLKCYIFLTFFLDIWDPWTVRQGQGKMGPEIARNLRFQLFQGVQFCHANRILHRDLKPQAGDGGGWWMGGWGWWVGVMGD